MYDSLFDCLFDMKMVEECVIGGLSDLKRRKKKETGRKVSNRFECNTFLFYLFIFSDSIHFSSFSTNPLHFTLCIQQTPKNE